MAFNQYMHPKNFYKNNPPDFRAMAAVYPEFRKHCQIDTVGKVHFDFKNPEAVLTLTKTLLRKDFDLLIDIPADSLVPRVPARLNYLLWLQDLIDENFPSDRVINCIDIGTGASCIYPLLGVKVFKNWTFTAVEALSANADCARKNVHLNALDDRIEVVHVTKDQSLSEIIPSFRCTKYHVWMCNPPFFDTDELQGSRAVIPTDPHSATVGKPEEMRTEGGEVQFVTRLIKDSVKLGTKVRIYTSLLGRKASLRPVLSTLKDCNVAGMCQTMFGQGRTLRWAVAWTFDKDVSLESKDEREEKGKRKLKRVSYVSSLSEADLQPLTMAAVRQWLEQVFTECNIAFKLVSSSTNAVTYSGRASENRWTGSRRKRRLAEQQTSSSKTAKLEGSNQTNRANNEDGVAEQRVIATLISPKPIEPELELEVSAETSETDTIQVQFTFVSGPNPDLVHQLKQYCLNVLKQRVPHSSTVH